MLVSVRDDCGVQMVLAIRLRSGDVSLSGRIMSGFVRVGEGGGCSKSNAIVVEASSSPRDEAQTGRLAETVRASR